MTISLFFRGGRRWICYGDVLVRVTSSLDFYVSLDHCKGDARFVDVQVSSEGMIMVVVVLVDDGVLTF